MDWGPSKGSVEIEFDSEYGMDTYVLHAFSENSSYNSAIIHGLTLEDIKNWMMDLGQLLAREAAKDTTDPMNG